MRIRPASKTLKFILAPFLLLSFLFFLGCDQSRKPISIGFVGGLTGRVADLGIAGRDGSMLAIEEQNAAGGIHGRPIELIVADDMQNSISAVKAVNDLIDKNVAAIIGHMTSSMSIVGAPIATQHKIVMFSPTTSTNELSGLDDYFFRVYPASAFAAQKLADHVVKVLGHKRVCVIYDIGNRAHTESWFLHFKKSLEALGGRIDGAIKYTSGTEVNFSNLSEEIRGYAPECLFILANAMDTAMLCQQLYKSGNMPQIVTSEWSATEDLIQFGGKSVDGLHFFHTFDKENTTPSFLHFQKTFKARFGYEAGFASAHSYDTAKIILRALLSDEDPSHLKETILEIKKFDGLQGQLTINQYGDIQRDLVLMTIKNGFFSVIEN